MANHEENESEIEISNLQPLKFTDITPGIVTSDRIIEGVVTYKCPLQTTKRGKYLKTVIREDESNSRISVFLFGIYAERCENLQIGNKLLFSNVTIEKSTTRSISSEHNHLCQILVDPSDTKAIIKIEKGVTDPNRGVIISSFDSPATSSSSDNVKNSRKSKDVDTSGKFYIYTKLKDAKPKSTVNVYGVVKYFRQPNKSRGTDYMMIVSLIDASFHDENDKLKCIIFNRDLHQFPAVKHVGDIVRFHRLNVSEFRGEPQGQNGPGFAWLVFGGNVDDPLEPRSASSPIYSLQDWDKEKLRALRDWRSEELSLSQEETQRVSTLSRVTCNAYLDLVCQVIGTALLKPSALLLLVWDGTKVNLPVMTECLDDRGETENIDDNLFVKAEGFIYHVKVFDDHVTAATEIKPGDIIQLRNLHAARYKTEVRLEDRSSLPTIELCLHQGTTYNRGLDILSLSSSAVKELTLILDEIPFPDDYDDKLMALKKRKKVPTEPEENNDIPGTTVVNSSPHSNTNPGWQAVVNRTNRSRDNPCNPSTFTTNIPSSERRCMQTSATIVTDHNHIKISSLDEIICGNVPYKYRARAKVVNLQPKADKVEDFLKLYCHACNFLASIKDFKEKPCANIINSVRYYSCPKCQPINENIKNKGTKQLEYIYMLQMILKDDSGQIMVELWQEKAVKFFDNIEPRRLLKDKSLFEEIRIGLQNLLGLCVNDPSDMTEPPWMECCLMSYSTECGTCYQIFDTILCMDESSI